MRLPLRSQPRLYIPGILILSFALRIFRLTEQSFWYDEGFTVYFARLPLREQLAALVEINPIPFHYLLISGWMSLAGMSEFSLRFLSVLGAVLTVALCYRLGARLANPTTGLVAALALAISPMHIYYGQETRPYAWLTALVLAAALLLYRAPAGLSRSDVILLSVAQALVLFTQVYGAFTILALNLVVLAHFLARRLPWRAVWPWAIANSLTLLLVVPWFWAARGTALSNVIYFRGAAPLRQILGNAVQNFSVGQASPGLPQGMMLFLLLAAVAILVALASRLRFRWAFLLAAAFSPPVGIILASIERSRYNARYIIAALPFFFLLFALTHDRLRRRAWPAGAIYGGMLLALFFYLGWGTYNQYYDTRFFRPDFRAVSAYLEEYGDPAYDGIVMVGGHFHPIMRYFLGDSFGYYPIPPDVIHNVDRPVTYRDMEVLNQAAQQHTRLWLILWQPELADPAGLVLDQLVSRTIRHIVFRDFGEISLLMFELPPGVVFETDPQPRVRIGERWQPGVELLGYDLEPGVEVAPEQPLSLVLHWQAQVDLQEDFFVSIQLIGADGLLHAQADHLAFTEYYPASQWRVGEHLVDRYHLDIPPSVPPGEYRLIAVLYNRELERWLTEEGHDFVELVPRVEVTR